MECDSILTSIKGSIGIVEEDTSFDAQIIMHINSVFMILNQLGVGPEKCFSISDANATWSDFISSGGNIQSVKTYMGLKVRLMFDPPTSSSVMDAINRMISELEWRLNIEGDMHTAEQNKTALQDISDKLDNLV